MTLVRCGECGAEISDQAWSCPKCGYPMKPPKFPYRIGMGAYGIWGYEWESETRLFGIPLVHVAIGWDMETGRLLVARGIIAIGQFAVGLITIAQFGIGLLFCLAQFGAGTVAIGQFALGLYYGLGQFATGMTAVGQFTHLWKRPG